MRRNSLFLALFFLACEAPQPTPSPSAAGVVGSDGGSSNDGSPDGGSSNGGSPDAGASAPCGIPGLACCAGGIACLGSMCDNSTCVSCGNFDEPCCAGGCNQPFACIDQRCQAQGPCGDVGLPCCPGSTCNAPNVCGTNGACEAGTSNPGNSCIASAATGCLLQSDCCSNEDDCVAKAGQNHCCKMPGGHCTTQADCCGKMECSAGGLCALRDQGQSCVYDGECELGLECDSFTDSCQAP